MYIFKLQLNLIESIESLARHLPHPIASRLELLADHWRDMVKLEMLRELEQMHKDVGFLRKEISEMKSAAYGIRNFRQRSDRDDKGSLK